MSKLILFLVDVSGSMGEAAAKSEEGKIYSRLDFVKQSILFATNIIDDDTTMGIVSFNTRGQVVLPPTKKGGREEYIKQVIMNMNPGGGTNIGAGLSLCYENCDNYSDITIILMSDGADHDLNENNSDDVMCRIFGSETKIKIDTIGFGPDANTKLLVKIASFASGTYALCYDATMVGTIIGRAVARTYLGEKAFGIQNTSDPHFMIYDQIRMNLSTVLLEQSNFLTENQQKLQDISTFTENYLRGHEPNSECYTYIMNTYTDMVGELQMGVSTQDYWNMWGKAYWTTMGIALKKQYAPNFKDISLQHFGTDEAKEMYECFSEKYSDMTMVPASRATYYNVRAPTNLSTSTFNNRDIGCFHMDSIMLRNTGQPIKVNEIIRMLQNDEEVLLRGHTNGNDIVVQVETVIITPYDNCDFYKVNDCILTKHHPIMVNGKWQHPKNVTTDIILESKPGFVFNIILTKRNNVRDQAIYVNDELCVCLGHGIDDQSDAVDPFWGTEKVVEKYASYSTNKVIEAKTMNVRDPKNNFTMDIVFV